jgi:hypothetical protein
MLRVVAFDGAYGGGNKNCARLGIKPFVFDQANLLIAGPLIGRTNLDPGGFLGRPFP